MLKHQKILSKFKITRKLVGNDIYNTIQFAMVKYANEYHRDKLNEIKSEIDKVLLK